VRTPCEQLVRCSNAIHSTNDIHNMVYSSLQFEFAMPTAACIQLGLRILVFLGDSSTDICTTTLGSYKYCTVRTCWLSPAFSAGSCGLLKLIGTARLSIRSSIVEFLAARTARPGHHRIMHASRCSQKPKPKQTNTYLVQLYSTTPVVPPATG
jgi:hypothetical protein